VRHVWVKAQLWQDWWLSSVLGCEEGFGDPGVNHVNGLFRVSGYGVVFNVIDEADRATEGVEAIKGKLKELPHPVF
jgi:hypothetical protein